MFKTLLVLILSVGIVQAAELIGRDFPYYIYQDEGKLRYCKQPDSPQQSHQSCWSNGVETMCKIVPIDAGYIDCNDSIKPNDDEGT